MSILNATSATTTRADSFETDDPLEGGFAASSRLSIVRQHASFDGGIDLYEVDEEYL